MTTKLYIKKLLNPFGFEIFNKKLLEKADNPYFVLSKVLKDYNVKTIIDGGTSIRSNGLILAKLFHPSRFYFLIPYCSSKLLCP